MESFIRMLYYICQARNCFSDPVYFLCYVLMINKSFHIADNFCPS